jgi:hypothetical protein
MSGWETVFLLGLVMGFVFGVIVGIVYRNKELIVDSNTTVVSTGEVMEFKVTVPVITIRDDSNQVVWQLEIVDGKLVFSGDERAADSAAKILFECALKQFCDTYIAEQLKVK